MAQHSWQELAAGVRAGNPLLLTKAISLVENRKSGHTELLSSLYAQKRNCPVLAITGMPGAGKSTLINALIAEVVKTGKRLAVLAVDPTSPFSGGAFLGDRIRFSDDYPTERVFMRSFATRGSVGGVSNALLDILQVIQAAPFDLAIIETVGVGQSEIAINAFADAILLVVVPEMGDEVQILKGGIMEIPSLIAINKCDLPGVPKLENALHAFVKAPYYKVTAKNGTGVSELYQAIAERLASASPRDLRATILANKLESLVRELSERLLPAADTENGGNPYTRFAALEARIRALEIS